MKVILVTGGAGFIGSHLLEELASSGEYRLYSLDNYSSGSKDNHVPGVEYIEGDTVDIDKHVGSVPDIIFHLGEYSRVERSFEDIELVWNSNTRGTQSVLEFCRKNNCKLVYAGSSTKFGDGGTGQSQSPYAWSKASNTELVKNYGRWFELEYAITYFYNVYGGREIANGDYATVVGIFKEAYKRGEPLTVVSPGTQLRNFTHIDDIISGLRAVGFNGLGDEFGIGSQSAYSIIEIAEMFGGEIQMIPERRGNRMTADLIVSKTEALGWKAQIDIRDHIRDFIFDSN